MSQRPMVAIPTYLIPSTIISGWTSDAYGVPRGYVAALRRSGLWPVLLPGPDPGAPEDVLAPFSGLLLAGGGDLHPTRYGGEWRPEIYGVDPDRDDIEFDLYRAARRSGVPVFAICRGFQLVNVATGGGIIQHLPDAGLSVGHGQPVTGLSNLHGVRVHGGSTLHGIVGSDRIDDCVSHHHQGVHRLGEGLTAVAWSDDGLVEAVEDGEEGWLLAVQWHPELSAANDPVQQSIFDAFGDEVRRRAAAQVEA